MTAYRERMLNGDYQPNPATTVTLHLNGEQIAKTVTRSRKRAKRATTKKTSS